MKTLIVAVFTLLVLCGCQEQWDIVTDGEMYKWRYKSPSGNTHYSYASYGRPADAMASMREIQKLMNEPSDKDVFTQVVDITENHDGESK